MAPFLSTRFIIHCISWMSTHILLLLLLLILIHCVTVYGFDKIELEDTTIYFPLKIDYVAPFGCALEGKTCDDEGAAYIPAAVQVALERFDKNPNLEIFHNLSVNYVDTAKIEGPRAAKSVAMNDETIAVVGLSRDCYIQTTILNINNKIGVSDYCHMDLSRVKGFDQSTVLLNSATDPLAKAVMYFLKMYEWKKVAVVSPSTTLPAFDTKARSDLLDTLANNDIDILLDSRVNPNAELRTISKKIGEDAKKARIFIILDWSQNAKILRNYLFKFGELNKIQSGEYFIIAFVSYSANYQWLDDTSGSRKLLHLGVDSIDEFNITDHDLQTIYRNLVILSDGPPPVTPNSTWAQVQKKVKDAAKKAICPPFCDGNISKKIVPRWDRIKSVFDSLDYLAHSVDDALKLGKNIYITENLYEFMLSRTIESVAGVNEYVGGFGNAIGSMQVYKFFSSKIHNTYSLFPCARLSQESILASEWILTDYEEGLSINFINGSPPGDTPKCGFHDEFCGPPPNYTFIIVISCGAFLLIVLSVAAFFLYRRYRYERRLHSLHLLIDRNQIILKKHVNLMSQQSLRSMASVQGSFIQASQTLKNSTFFLEDYQQDETSNVSTIFGESQTGSMIGSGVFRQSGSATNETTDDLRWHSLSDFAVGLYEGRTVGLKRIYRSDIELTRNVRMEIAQLQESANPNIIGFLGMMVQAPDVFVVYELAQRGSLKDILDNDELPLDDIFMKQMTKDIVAGLEYLHNSPVGCHGRLKSTNCLIDSRWMVRLSSFGLRELRMDENPIRDDVQDGRDDLWTAPELLRWSTGLAQCSPLLVQKADVYSLAIVLYETFGRAGPWGEEPMEPREIVNRVKRGETEGKRAFRPDIAVVKDAPKIVQETISASWVEDPAERPSLFQIKRKLRPLTAGLKRTIMDNMVSMIEKYTAKLEKDIAERNEELEAEKEKSEMLLKMMLPDVVADSLKRGNNVTAESFDSVTIFFSDCPGFAELSASSQPFEIVQFLNDLYTCFDNVISKYDVYKVETIADSYMVASGLPIPNGKHHVGEIASMGLALLDAVKDFRIKHRPEDKVRLRIGMNSGPCVAGVIGLKMPRYCLFGDTVNTASRMESNGIPLRINCSESAKQLLELLGGYEIEERGLVEMRGKGKQMTYFVRGENPAARRDRILKDRVKYATLKKAIVDEKKIEFS
ncbi:unnamed protein product [Caenorhabditis bovis]|uniref:Guanylate cyclase n=1 Tax=Caenorhabditis bovis TaxID=2654633 RepID=A0A8S1EWQ3_9PELO|nr:unnamed protein product [Caenorhabditis bovis]